MNMNISNDALIEALRNARVAVQVEDDPGLSRREISRALGWGRSKTKEALRALFEAGELEVGKRRDTDMVGRTYWVPVYRLRDKQDTI